MSRLIARFDVNLRGGSFLFKRPMIDDLSYRTTIRDFEVELCLNANIPACFRNDHKKGESVPEEFTDENYYWAISKVRIQSSRNEDKTVPMPQKINGRTSYEERCRYFDELKPAYRQVAWEVLDRAVLFFKYHLHNPNIASVNQYGEDFQNPVWIDECGKKIENNAWFGSELLYLRLVALVLDPCPAMTTLIL